MNAFKKGLNGEEDLETSAPHRETVGARSPDAVLPASEKKA
jgi:hypothetical protein